MNVRTASPQKCVRITPRHSCSANSLITFMCRLSTILGASNSLSHKGLSRLVEGLLYLYSCSLRGCHDCTLRPTWHCRVVAQLYPALNTQTTFCIAHNSNNRAQQSLTHQWSLRWRSQYADRSTHSFVILHFYLRTLSIHIDIDIYVNCNWVDTRWQ